MLKYQLHVEAETSQHLYRRLLQQRRAQASEVHSGSGQRRDSPAVLRWIEARDV